MEVALFPNLRYFLPYAKIIIVIVMCGDSNMNFLDEEFHEDFFNGKYFMKIYNTYKAEFVHKTRLPVFDSNNYVYKDRRFLSKTKCKLIKMPISDKELPVAWYRCKNGYCPLYFREWEETKENIEKVNRRSY